MTIVELKKLTDDVFLSLRELLVSLSLSPYSLRAETPMVLFKIPSTESTPVVDKPITLEEGL
jgi:hypothetical protein